MMKWQQKSTLRIFVITFFALYLCIHVFHETKQLSKQTNNRIFVASRNNYTNDRYGLDQLFRTTGEESFTAVDDDDKIEDRNDVLSINLTVDIRRNNNTNDDSAVTVDPLFQTTKEDSITSLDDDDIAEEGEDVLAINPTNALTGSFVNCTSQRNKRQLDSFETTHPDSGILTVSCNSIRYRAPIKSFNISNDPIIVGILSNAGDNGPRRRKTIRNTWAKKHSRVFFIVAGPWDVISSEYKRYGDLIWIDKDEIYNKHHSVLQMKTLSFLSIIHEISEKLQNVEYSYAFKTDDDSYVDIDALNNILKANETYSPDYWGHCGKEMHEPKRGAEYKWSISIEDYPYPFYPLYCQGAGYAMSHSFIDCVSGVGEHISRLMPIPFEDAAVGMLAERCHIKPTTNYEAVHLHRYTSKEAKERIKRGESLKDLPPAPPACMAGKVVQHRIFSELDMRNHYRTNLDPPYCDEVKAQYDLEMATRGKKGEPS